MKLLNISLIVCAALLAAGLLTSPAQAEEGFDYTHVSLSFIGPLKGKAEPDNGTVIGTKELTPTFSAYELDLGQVGASGGLTTVFGFQFEEDDQNIMGTEAKFEADRTYLGLKLHLPLAQEGHFAYVGGGAHWTDYEASGGGMKTSWDDSGAWVGGGWYYRARNGLTFGVDAKWWDDESHIPGERGDFETTTVGFRVGWSF